MPTQAPDPTPEIAHSSPAPTLIIGLGNLLLSDEGVGIHVLRQLQQHYAFVPRVELVDGGTTGLDLLALFQTHDTVLLIDALFLPEAVPGEIQVLRDKAILATLTKKLSMHHLGISDVLALCELLDEHPREMVLVGIVPEHLELGTVLSPSVTERLPAILREIGAILRCWNIDMQAIEPNAVRTAPTDAMLFGV